MKRFLIAVVVVLCAACCAAQIGGLPKSDTSLSETTDTKFQPGDVWEYKTRPGEQRSRLTILRLDKSPELGAIVHVAVNNIRLSNCTGGPEPNAIPHMPFARKALEASVTKRIGIADEIPAFQDGYNEWHDAYSKKRAGIYLIPVADAVSVAEYTFRQGIGCESDKDSAGKKQ